MRRFMIWVIFIPLLHSPSVGLFLNCIILLALLAVPLTSKSEMRTFPGVTDATGPGRSHSRPACGADSSRCRRGPDISLTERQGLTGTAGGAGVAGLLQGDGCSMTSTRWTRDFCTGKGRGPR